MPNNKEKKFITDSPKLNFFIGLILGIAILGVTGFGIMLAKDNDGETNKNPEVAGDQQDAPQKINFEITNEDNVLGDKDAPIKIFEFSDFQCPYCARFHEVMNQIVEEFDGKVAWVFKHFPINSHPLAMPGALASECAGDQDKFWEMSDLIFEDLASLDKDSFEKFGEELDLNMDDFNSCVAEEKYKDKILADYNMGIDAGVGGTPTSFINGKMLPGAVPFENMKEIIEELLAE